MNNDPNSFGNRLRYKDDGTERGTKVSNKMRTTLCRDCEPEYRSGGQVCKSHRSVGPNGIL